MPGEIIDRATYKRIKKYNRQELNIWLTKFGTEIYNDGCRDAACAEILALRDEFNFGTSRISRFMQKRDNTIDSINKKLVTVSEIIDGLREEGLRIKTDFEVNVRSGNDVDENMPCGDSDA